MIASFIPALAVSSNADATTVDFLAEGVLKHTVNEITVSHNVENLTGGTLGLVSWNGGGSFNNVYYGTPDAPIVVTTDKNDETEPTTTTDKPVTDPGKTTEPGTDKDPGSDPAVTDKPSDPGVRSGCKGNFGGAAAVISAIAVISAAGALAIRKKKED